VDLIARFKGESAITVIGKPYTPDDLLAALRTVGIRW
jgi:hypothetical protein